jgi:hypothetical protein
MPARHVVVDGSNIATEGSSLPSLKQLDEAVREYLRENPDDTVTVVVDATFGHRIPAEEREAFEKAEREGDIVSPPAGAIGRGDAFLLRIADKVGAVVLSNDSFQEFHGEHDWLFDEGRLIGGKPVPGVGWIFTPRTPVRGPKSRESVKEAKRKRRVEDAEDSLVGGLELAAERSQGRSGTSKLQKAIELATEEAVVPDKAAKKRRRRRRGAEAPSEPVNDPLSFISFIASYRPGDTLEGVVEEFSSHGAHVAAGGARCYLPLSAMGNPPPRSAREAVRKGEERKFVVQAFDPMRRGIELALPGFAHPAGAPTPETVEAEIHLVEELAITGPNEKATAASGAPALKKKASRQRAREEATEPKATAAVDGQASAGNSVPADDEGEDKPADEAHGTPKSRRTKTGTAKAGGGPADARLSREEGLAGGPPPSERQPAGPNKRAARSSTRRPHNQAADEGQPPPQPERTERRARKRATTLSSLSSTGEPGPQAPETSKAPAGKTVAKGTKPKLTVLPGSLARTVATGKRH